MLFGAMAKHAASHTHQVPALFHSRSRLKIGLVGGSFNPAHEGHIHVALEARRALGLDQIWWLVTPQNPLKSSAGMASLATRLAYARDIASGYPFLRVLAPESALPKNYTYDTLIYIKKTMPLARLVWIMGADNLDQFSRWYRHKGLIRLLPIAVIDRPSYSLRAIASGRWLLGRRYQVGEMRRAITTRHLKLPGWCFIAGKRHVASATEIRQQAQRANA